MMIQIIVCDLLEYISTAGQQCRRAAGRTGRRADGRDKARCLREGTQGRVAVIVTSSYNSC